MRHKKAAPKGGRVVVCIARGQNVTLAVLEQVEVFSSQTW